MPTITDKRKKVMVGANPLPGNVILMEDKITLFIQTDQGFFNLVSGNKFPYSYKEICEVRSLHLFDNFLEATAFLLESRTPQSSH